MENYLTPSHILLTLVTRHAIMRVHYYLFIYLSPKPYFWVYLQSL